MPDSGTVFLDGEPLRPDHIQHIGYLPEERGLYKSMRGRGAVCVPCTVKRFVCKRGEKTIEILV